jgi:hypothetical protein
LLVLTDIDASTLVFSKLRTFLYLAMFPSVHLQVHLESRVSRLQP